MAEARIPVDVFNPGQVFACLGLMETAGILLGDVEGAFDWHDAAQTLFVLRAAGEEDPLQAVLDFLRQAEVLAWAPEDSSHVEKPIKSKVAGTVIAVRETSPKTPFPSPDNGRDRLPAILRHDGREIRVDYWSDVKAHTGRDNVKFWAGAGGYPGVALLKDALHLMQDHWEEARTDPFNIAVAQSSSFRLDWRRDYVPLAIGFSLNQHTHVVTLGYPLVEILAAIGLSHARPGRIDKLNYRYAIVGRDDDRSCYPPMFLRAGLGGAPLPFPMRRFRMQLGWPGQEGQARCITNVYEEN